jgi:hypothetical protein
MTLRAGVAKLAGVALAGSLLVFAAPAAAKPCTHATGNSEVDQYLENVPGPCGNQGIGGNGSGHHGTTSSGPTAGSSSSASGLPSGTISQLQGSGPAGQQAASFARQTNPTGNGGGSNGTSPSSSSDEGTGSSGDGSLLSALQHLVTGNDTSASDTGAGLGTILPALLVVVLLGGVAVLALRRRRTG